VDLSNAEVRDRNRAAYDAVGAARDDTPVELWKAHERERVRDLLRATGHQRVLDVGAGTGVHGRWFADQGFAVVCVDASRVMVEVCRSKGLEAHQHDFDALPADWQVDAVFAMNCLLHVPRAELEAVLASLHRVLIPGGSFYWGQYGGIDRESIFRGGAYTTGRFFSYLTDARMRAAAETVGFEIVELHAVDVDVHDDPGVHFQALTARRS